MNLEEIAATLRTCGVPTDERTKILAAIRSAAANSVDTDDADTAPSPVARLGIAASRRLGVTVPLVGIRAAAFDQAAAGKNPSDRLVAKSLLHRAGLLIEE